MQRAYVYEIVMREGTDDDVRRFIDLDQLIDMWPRLFLLAEVRRAWADRLRVHSGVRLAC